MLSSLTDKVDALIEKSPHTFLLREELVTNELIIYAAAKLHKQTIKTFNILVSETYYSSHGIVELTNECFTAIGDLIKANDNIIVLTIQGVNFEFNQNHQPDESEDIKLPGLEYMLNQAVSIHHLSLRYVANYDPTAAPTAPQNIGNKHYSIVGPLLSDLLKCNSSLTLLNINSDKIDGGGNTHSEITTCLENNMLRKQL